MPLLAIGAAGISRTTSTTSFGRLSYHQRTPSPPANTPTKRATTGAISSTHGIGGRNLRAAGGSEGGATSSGGLGVTAFGASFLEGAGRATRADPNTFAEHFEHLMRSRTASAGADSLAPQVGQTIRIVDIAGAFGRPDHLTQAGPLPP
jgi:hypothetical protein